HKTFVELNWLLGTWCWKTNVELSGFLGTKIHGLSTDVQCETISQHRSITMTAG
ncbi:hypothetical protein N657DRAFT_651157, partial [Parathielavia appendiculata]